MTIGQPIPSPADERVRNAQSYPIRAHILNILGEGPNSPSRIQRRMPHVSLSLVCYHVKVLRKVGLIEQVEVRKYGGRKERIYRATKRQLFTFEEWMAIDPPLRDPLIGTILRQISDDTGRAAAEGRFSEIPDSHLSRSPIELDAEGWQEVVLALEEALDSVLEAHARSKERAQVSGEALMVARVMIMQFPIGREDPRERDEESERG